MFSVDYIVNLLSSYGEFAIIISVILSIIISILGIVPSVFVTGANILFFGPIGGFFISLFGEVFGGWITFKLYRKGFKKGFDNITEKHSLLKKISKSKGNEAAFLILQGRIIPFIPSGFVTLAASLCEIDDLRYNLATLIGKIPSILLEVFISYGIITQGKFAIEIIFTFLGIYFIYKTIKKFKV